MATRKQKPEPVQLENKLPNTESSTREMPSTASQDKSLPQIGSPENTVAIGGNLIEIKPTKLKYMRNRTAAFYRILEIYPLADILAMEAGVFDDERDGDKALYDWLVAVTDDEKLIRKHYDELDGGTIEKLLIIYRRLNKVDEKENLLKNMTPTGKEG